MLGIVWHQPEAGQDKDSHGQIVMKTKDEHIP